MTPLTELNLEKGTYDLFAQWLAAYFDGAAHAVGGNAPVTFPRAALGFAQSAMPQPLNPPAATPQTPPPPVPQVGITMTFAPGAGRPQRRWETVGAGRQQMFYKAVRWNFWIRCATADNAARACAMNAGQLLEAILANKQETRGLAQNGVHRIRPGTPEPVADTAYILRLLTCQAVLKYAVRSQA